MLRWSLALSLLAVVFAGTALADLAIVQQWPVDQFPGGIAYDADRDHIWLVNDSTGEVREYTRTGTYIGMFLGSQVGATWPVGLDFDNAQLHLWIADEFNPETIIECTRDAVQVSSFSVDDDMQDAVAIAYNVNNDHVYVGDDNASEVVEWTADGAYVGRWTSAPVVDTDAICYLASNNTLLVGDDNAAIVCEFSLAGVPLNTWDMTTLGMGGVEGLSFDAATGNVFLGDSTTGARFIYEISGFAAATAVQPSTWGGIKSIFN